MKKSLVRWMQVVCLLNFTATFQTSTAQDCKTNADLDATPGKYLTAAQYPWPAVRAEYYKKMTTATDKAMAKQVLEQIEKIEHQSHSGFHLTGGNWENIFSTDGYGYFGTVKLANYTFQSALHEFFCSKGKLVRNEEYSTILRIYANRIPFNTLNRFLTEPFGNSMGEYNFGFQYLDWKNRKSTDVNAQMISLFSYISCINPSLVEAINSGNSYFQDVAEKDIRQNSRSNYVYRYWFIKKKNAPVLIPVSRKEYLQSLLEYYEREKLYFPKLIAKLTNEHDDAAAKRYTNWEADVADKITVVKKVLNEQDEKWLSAQAVIHRLNDNTQNYKAKYFERTNYNRFWKFYDGENRSEPLYKYNRDYFKPGVNPAKPQIISIAFRYVTIPSSIRLLNNFTENFDFSALKKLVE